MRGGPTPERLEELRYEAEAWPKGDFKGHEMLEVFEEITMLESEIDALRNKMKLFESLNGYYGTQLEKIREILDPP